MSTVLYLLLFTVASGTLIWSADVLYRRFVQPHIPASASARGAVRAGSRRDMFLPRSEIVELARMELGAGGSSLPAYASERSRPYPGWSILQVLNALDREGVTVRGSADVEDCEGVWLRPSGYVLLVPRGDDPGEVLAAALHVESEGRRRSHIYLSRQEVFALAHNSFYIAVNHDYHRRHVERHHPGWSWDELYGTLKRSGLLHREEGGVTTRHLPDGAVGVLIGRDGSTRVECEEGSRPSE